MIIILSYDLAFSVDDANSRAADQYFPLIPLYDKCGLDFLHKRREVLIYLVFYPGFKSIQTLSVKMELQITAKLIRLPSITTFADDSTTLCASISPSVVLLLKLTVASKAERG